MDAEIKTAPDANWWGPFSLAVGESMIWEIGAVRFAVQRQSMEWCIACIDRDQIIEGEWHRTRASGDVDEFADGWERFAYGHETTPLSLSPALADRPVVSRPSSPFTLLPGEELDVFVSTPLWATVVTDEADVLLKEFSLFPLSDTWFGPSTREGELCYATRTHARLVPDAKPMYVHRATTVVKLKNRLPTALLIERIKLPVPYLSLYDDGSGSLWTEAVDVVTEHEDHSAELKIKSGPPAGFRGAHRLAEPREDPRGEGLVHALGSFFGQRG